MQRTLDQLVAANSEKFPDMPAVVCEDTTLTYAALEERVSQLSATLLRLGAVRGDRIGIFMDKALEGAVAMYGIMRSGCAYVPLDPSAPTERLIAILHDCDIHCLITSSAKKRTLNVLSQSKTPLQCLIGVSADTVDNIECISWDDVAAAATHTALPAQVDEHDVAYIIYTSGSTGTPKGIIHTHLSSLSFSRWAASEYQLNNLDRLSNHAPLHFDLSILDYFSAAVVGACTVIITEDYIRLPASYSELLAKQRISVLYTVPFALIQLLARGVLEQRDLKSLRWIIFAGEPYPSKHLRGLMDKLPWVQFDNMYGPAEINGCSHFTVPGDFKVGDPIPIGPIANIAESLIIDSNDDLVSAHEIGELLVKTPTMMRGYWSRPDLNSRVFCNPEQDPHDNAKYFRTGDLVHRDEHGNMYFVGRKDRQIKVRGYRIELDEIESALTALKDVEESAVFAVPDTEGSQMLMAVALLMPDSNSTSSDLVLELRKQLPRYAIPTEISCVDTLPRTTTGKIDRNQLAQVAAKKKASL